MADPAPLVDVRHGWVWSVLPPQCRAVGVVGDEGLEESLRAAGLTAVGEIGSPQAIVGTFHRWPRRRDRATVLRRAESAQFVGMAVIDERVAAPERSSRVGLVLRGLASAPRAVVASLRARRAARALRGVGLTVSSTPIGDTGHGLILGRGRAMFRRRAFATGSLLVGHRGGERDSLLDLACGEASRAVAGEVTSEWTVILRTGTVMTELTGPAGDRYLLRVGGGPAARLLSRSVVNRVALSAKRPPRAVRDRLSVPLGYGTVGPAVWTVEHKVPGHSPKSLEAGVRQGCVEFLVGLHMVSAGGERRSDGVQGWSLQQEFSAIAKHVRGPARSTLARLARELGLRLEDVPRGWAHGDFWSANLLANGDHLLAVVDWDSASPGVPALLDLMHLIALARRPKMSHGMRCTTFLWPLAREGGDSEMRYYCQATGCPTDARTLEGLALAYWVWRVGRDLLIYRDRPGRSAWMAENLHRPLEELQRSGW